MPIDIASLKNLLEQYSDVVYFYLPLGVIGVWRWGSWALKELIALFYRPQEDVYQADVSIITPVYNEDPQIFAQALKSWAENEPREIIAVVDYSDEDCIEVFKNFTKENSSARLIITREPGKRSALALGILRARSEIVALVDSDTIWKENVLKNAIAPFEDLKVAGVGTRQNVLTPQTLAQKIFDIQLDQRYCDEMPFLAVGSRVLTCLSGRTAFYRRAVVLPLLDRLVNETFLGRRVVSGEDKRLTYLVGALGWKMTFQSSAQVFTPGAEDLRSFYKQRLRWSRNSWRADLRALLQGWAFKHPFLAFQLIDRIFQPFTLLLGPIFLLIFLFSQAYLPALVLIVWWHFSRLIKLLPHLRRRPQDVIILPFYIISSYVFGIIRIYAFFTLNTQGWITRWDIRRLPKLNWMRRAPAYLATFSILLVLFGSTAFYKQSPFVPAALAKVHPNYIDLGEAILDPQPADMLWEDKNNKSFKPPLTRYKVQPGDTLEGVADKFGIQKANLVSANIAYLPNINSIEPGLVVVIPFEDLKVETRPNYHTFVKYLPKAEITYDQGSNTIFVKGRGNQVRLTEISGTVGGDRLVQVGPKEWFLKANLLVQNGVVLRLEKDEVTWLKLKSDEKGFVWLKAHNGLIDMNGIRITSWDEGKNDVDRNYQDGRSFIVAKYSSVLNISGSELAYLGYKPPPIQDASTFGVSWKIPKGTFGKYLLTGEARNSKFHHNYFGAYIYGARGMLWQGNELYDNVVYGFDPHDDSSGFLIEGNKVYNNGSHGLILSKRCTNNLIRNNLIYNNSGHGIMLHEDSNDNLLEDNTVYGNSGGVVLYNSKRNIVRGNTVSQNKSGLRVSYNSQENLISENLISGSSQYGVYLYGNAGGNFITNNSFSENPVALYIKTSENLIRDNNVRASRTGIYLKGQASGNKFAGNQINDSSLFTVLTRTGAGQKNYISH